MDSLIAELKRAREAKRMSLSDVADSTLISLKFLEEIERGNLTFLPQTYVRAFIRDYSKAVDLDPEEMMRRLDEATGGGSAKPTPKKEAPAQTPSIEPAQSTEVPQSPSVNPRSARMATIVIIALAVAVALWNLLTRTSETPVEEIPFDKVLKEQTPVESDTANNERAPSPVKPDTLTLLAVARDSVWVQLAIDNSVARRYVLKPNSRKSWKAAEKFSVTLGNAGAVEFTLNTKVIGKLGKQGAVVRNVELSHATLGKK